MTARFALELKELPADARKWLKETDATIVRIGSTTFQSSTWAVIEKSEQGIQSRGLGGA
jgi:hypothetical protein